MAERNFQQAHILFSFKYLACFSRECGCNQYFNELLGNRFSGFAIHFNIQRNDAAKCGGRIRLQGFCISVRSIDTQRHAAGVGVFDDDAGATFETFDTFPCRIGISDVVVRELLAL